MSIYERLKEDHDEVKELLEKLKETSPRAAKTRERLFEQLKEMVTAHSRAEEAAFYDAIKAKKPTHDLAMEGYEEHHVVDLILGEMSKLAASDEQWQAKFSVLKENLEHHIEEEESETFKQAREVLSADEAEEIGEAFSRREAKRLARA